jgi:dTDP-4-dehydrorhamnose reductase
MQIAPAKLARFFMKLFIVGCNGQLGKELMAIASAAGHSVSGKDVPDIDITNVRSITAMITAEKPDVIINCAAYTAVDACETHQSEAYAVNSQGVANIAAAGRQCGSRFVHYSTDYVFDGKSNKPYIESDPVNPQSEYGKSKLEGERRLAEILSDHLILRIAWLYGVHGRHYIKKIKERALVVKKTKEPLKVVTDEVGTPTYCADVCRQTLLLLEKNCRGIYHSTSEGSCSRYEFAQEILRAYHIDVPLIPCLSSEFKLPAPRPAYSVLENKRLKDLGINIMREWKAAFAEYVEQEKNVSGAIS